MRFDLHPLLYPHHDALADGALELGQGCFDRVAAGR
jgi:hypothetical protein